jgi:hypothetical protein
MIRCWAASDLDAARFVSHKLIGKKESFFSSKLNLNALSLHGIMNRTKELNCSVR